MKSIILLGAKTNWIPILIWIIWNRNWVGNNAVENDLGGLSALITGNLILIHACLVYTCVSWYLLKLDRHTETYHAASLGV